MLDSILDIWTGILEHLPLLTIGVVILTLTGLVAWAFGRFSPVILKRIRTRASLKQLLSRFVLIAIWIAGLLRAAMVVFPGVTPGKLLATLGLGSIAIGFAFKDIFENFFAGIMLLWRFPFENGDYIECNDIRGKVEDVTLRNTFLRRSTGELVVLPNATLFKNPVDVLTNWPHRRVTIICGVAYGEDIDESRKVIEEAVMGCETLDQDQPVQIFAREFADSSVNFEVTWWTGAKPVEVRKSRDEVVAAVKRALDEAEIEIPFPYRTLTFKEPLRTLSGESNEEPPPEGKLEADSDS